jgi:hypothetical protein
MIAPRQRLVAVLNLTARGHREVDDLVALCKQHEPIDLPLLLDPFVSAPDDTNPYFLAYDKGALFGAAST